MQKPLRKQVAQIVTSRDPRYFPSAKPEPIEQPSKQSPPEESCREPKVQYFYYKSPCCDLFCRTLHNENGTQVCECGKRYSCSDPSLKRLTARKMS